MCADYFKLHSVPHYTKYVQKKFYEQKTYLNEVWVSFIAFLFYEVHRKKIKIVSIWLYFVHILTLFNLKVT